jgi:hypothetical protein
MTTSQPDPMDHDDRVAQPQAAVRRAAAGSTEWALAVDQLAEAWLAANDLDRAIATRRMGLTGLASEAAHCRADLQHDLGVDLMTRYRRHGRSADLRTACRLAEAVFAAAPPADRLRAASDLAARWSAHPEDTDTLERARRFLADELAAAPQDDAARTAAANALAGIHLALWHRRNEFDGLTAALEKVLAEPVIPGAGAANVIGLLSEVAEESSDLALLAEAEKLARRSLAVVEGEPRVSVARLLAAILLTRHEWTGEAEVLAEAAEAGDDAVRTAEAAGNADLLAQALSVRSTVHGEAGRVFDDRTRTDAAIADAKRALALARSTTPETGEYTNQVALLLAERFDLFGTSEHLDQAIVLVDEELARGPAADEFAAIATNQATALLSRAELRTRPDPAGAAGDLLRGIELVEQAIKATPPGSAGLAARHSTASRLWAHRDTREALAIAGQHAEAAVDHCPPGSADRPLYLNNWAMLLKRVRELTAPDSEPAREIALLERAFEAARGRFGETSVLVASIRYNLGARLLEVFDLRLAAGTEDLALLQRAIDELDEALGADHPHLSVPAGRLLGDIAWRLSLWDKGEHAFRLALTAAGRLTGLRRHRQDKERARSGVQGIGALAALCAARDGNVAAAAVHLEQASATLIAEAVGVAADGVTFDGVVAGARLMDRHVLLLGTTAAGGIAVLVGPDGRATHAELPGLTEGAVAGRVAAFRETISATPDSAAAGRRDAADVLCRWTAKTVLDPLRPLLADVRRVAVLPLGRLAWLPLTAAAAPGTDADLSRLEPLLLIRATPAGRHGEVPAGPRRVVVWADTGPADARIPGAAREARRVAGSHPGAELVVHDRPAGDTEPEPTDDPAALTALFDADLLHLACHCEVDAERPQETVLHLSPPLRVGTAPPGRRARHAHIVLSACDAALTSATLPDEALSAATAFLLSGAGAVTAPLWPAGDAATPRFMAAYHAELAAGTAPPRALAKVQRAWAGRPKFFAASWVVTCWPDAAGVAAEKTGAR